ncbi:maleate cis-trans isomerase family protein [Streptomyces cavernicola]|uniref:Aspartate/glutamate racemase family protein n=1 Tax=Streptomyces cavernicola TaxID=3043613 RepID=A0ABT6SA20_9ACTN|nr:aspartate/glutamate racemase family protein [Streptomyces sp. B-S-A6]MDI3405032.1 aspartate/glutamate racemase family protein [Streptomyces sp. B-S-A6]
MSTVRIGMLTPSSNTCLEPVTYDLLHGTDAATAHFARVTVTRIALDSGADAQFDPAPMLAAARQLADAKVDVIAWNGTSGSWLGVDRDRSLCEAITAETGIPATTSTLALLDACAAYGVTRLGLALPYTGDVAEKIVQTYAKEGVVCTLAEPLGISENEAFARVPEADVARQIEAAAASGDDAHAVAVVCTNVYGARPAADLEPALGIPVFDSVAATLWKALDLAGAQPVLPGHGELLRSGSLRARIQEALSGLRAATGADRTTFRVDLPEHDLTVDRTAGETLGEGVRSIRRDASLDQRRLNTVEWLEQHRRPLVQPHFRDDPQPPQALVDVYGVHAQLLAPVERDGALAGWISVHSTTERDWSDGDSAAVADAVARIHAALDETS